MSQENILKSHIDIIWKCIEYKSTRNINFPTVPFCLVESGHLGHARFLKCFAYYYLYIYLGFGLFENKQNKDQLLSMLCITCKCTCYMLIKLNTVIFTMALFICDTFNFNFTFFF